MTDMGDVSRVLGMNVTRDRKKRTITIDQKYYTEDIVERFGMKGCNPAFTPVAGPELSLEQREKKQAAAPVDRKCHHIPRTGFPV